MQNRIYYLPSVSNPSRLIPLVFFRQSRSVIHDALIGSVSAAEEGSALRQTSTAQEVEIISDDAAHFCYRVSRLRH